MARTPADDIATDLHAVATQAYDHGHDRDGHLFERAGNMIEELARARTEVLEILSTQPRGLNEQIDRAIDVLEGVDA